MAPQPQKQKEMKNMEENKKLVMVFKNEVDKQVSISIDNPKSDITEQEI